MIQQIVYTRVDEAPALASVSLLPILRAFTAGTGIEFEEKDISLAGRILAAFSDRLAEEQCRPDHLAELARLVKQPDANIIKLPNISASVPQLRDAIHELQKQGYDLPDYPELPMTDDEKEVHSKYAGVLGSAVNPVLREGNSDRRVPASVKNIARKKPHGMMKEWPAESKARVAFMTDGDFYGSEKSVTLDDACEARIEFVNKKGDVTVLKPEFPLLEGEIIDAAVMNVRKLRSFYARQIDEAARDDVLLSLHLKATMMKVSDPIMFGHCVSVFFKDMLDKHEPVLQNLGVNLNNGLADLLTRIKELPETAEAEIKADIEDAFKGRCAIAMVDSSRGITNLHVPNNIIIDASMPVFIRDGGRMWGADDRLHDAIAMIPDRSYAGIYDVMVKECQQNGAFDPASMGTVANVGLMAQKAEEYGSHDKTFEAPGSGVIRVLDVESGEALLEQPVECGDIFRMCQTKDLPVQDWVKLAVNRARVSGMPALFWLDEKRAHDREVMAKVRKYLSDHDTSGLEISIMKPERAMRLTIERVRDGKDTIAVTGNVLRDYLTDLFPILEIGTSARMLSIVPLMNGGGLFETGAGGSAPKHVQQFLQEGHLRWDSLGEFCALVPSFEHVASVKECRDASLFAATLDRAIESYLEHGRSPSRKVHELDTRGSHFYLALYWAQALAEQADNEALQERFKPVADALEKSEDRIVEELISVQGNPVDIGGYYHPDPHMTAAAMRPSSTFNEIVNGLVMLQGAQNSMNEA